MHPVHQESNWHTLWGALFFQYFFFATCILPTVASYCASWIPIALKTQKHIISLRWLFHIWMQQGEGCFCLFTALLCQLLYILIRACLTFCAEHGLRLSHMLKSPCPLFDKRRINSWWHRCTHWWHIINSRLIEVIIVATHNERKRRPKSRHFMTGECPAKTSPLYSEWTPQHLECCGMLKTLNWTSLDHEHWVSKLAMLQDWQETGTVTDWSWFTCKQQGEPTGRYCRGSPGRLISRKISFQGQRESGIGFPKKLFPNIFIAENQFLFVYYF